MRETLGAQTVIGPGGKYFLEEGASLGLFVTIPWAGAKVLITILPVRMYKKPIVVQSW